MQDWTGLFFTIICLAGLFFALMKLSQEKRKNERQRNEIKKLNNDIADHVVVNSQQSENIQALENKNQQLSKYQHIIDVESEIASKEQAFSEKKQSAIAKIKEQVDAANAKINSQYDKARRKLEEAELEKKRIVQAAEEKAVEIAGKAYEAANRESQLQAAIKAMENSISGYNDSYLIPAETLLDELASQYDFKEAGQELKNARDRVRTMIKTQTAATCDYVEAKRRETAIRFVLDAFNGKVDTAMARLRHDNYGILKQQVIDAYSIVNNNGAAFRNARITQEYLEAVQDELKWAVATTELKRQDREEQKRIKQEMREEARAQREYEKAIKAAEKEEKLIQEAMEKARQQIAAASEEQKAEYEAQLQDLEDKLKVAEEKNQRAISMAQQTRQGHVYVISNIGSFGENVLKIGMTRRLEPMDRVKELGDASVPFPFDVHAMIYSEDAPSLETQLHQSFSVHQVNKVNPRKEFFSLELGTIKDFVQELGVDTHWTLKAEALEFRESRAIVNKQGASRMQMQDSSFMVNRENDHASFMTAQ